MTPQSGRRIRWAQGVATCAAVLCAVLFAYPFLWMITGSFKTNREIFRPDVFWPASFDASAVIALAQGTWFPFWRVLGNSVWLASGQALGAVLVTSLAGFAFARLRIPARSLLFALCLCVVAVPIEALAIPLFSWVHTLGLFDHPTGVLLPGIVSGLGVVYFTRVFQHIPTDLVDVARIEGANAWQMYLTVLPLARGSLIAFGLIHFILSWHQHLVPLLILDSPAHKTLPIAITSLYGSSLRFPYAALMAASAITLLPTALLFALFYRRIRSALSEVFSH